MAQQTLNTPRETTHQRIAAALEAIEQNMSDEHEAVNIDYDNTYSGLSADNVQEAIDELVNEKADKSTTLAGYGITDAYTKTETDTLLDGKVDKITGKGLSTNDYTTADKNKLAGIEAEANKTVVDSSMSDSSTNPLQNKVITKELEGTKTTTGNPLTIEDVAPVNAVNLSMDLEPIQDLHGYDHPWVGGAGKNKCPAYTSTETQYGVTIAGNSEGEISVNGTLDGTNLYGFILNSSISLGAGTYTLNGANPNGARLVLYDSNDNTLADTQDANPTFTLESTTTAVLRIFVYANVQYDEVVRPMIRLSTETDPTFAPYSNICPISGRTEEVITQKDNPTNPSVTKNYTIQLGQTVYGGQLDVTRGKMVVDRGYKTIADLESMSEGGDNFATGDIGAKRFSPTQLSTIISSHCPTVPQSPDPTQFSISGLHWVDGFQLWNTGCTNFNELKEQYGELQVCYELATPFTIDLTPQQIKLLENNNTISTDYEGDTITLEYQPNNAIGEAVRAVEESYDPEFAVRPVLKKKAFSGTTDSDGSVTLINASDIPSGHKIIPLQITDMTINGSAGTYFVEYEPYNSGDSVKGYCYTYHNGSQTTPVGSAVTGNFYYYELEG